MKDILTSLGLEADNPGTWLGAEALTDDDNTGTQCMLRIELVGAV